MDIIARTHEHDDGSSIPFPLLLHPMPKQLLVFIFFLTFLAPALSIYKSKQKPNLLSKTVENSITCDFSIHKKGPNGQKVSGASLDDEIYYKIKCQPISGNCLQVVNCTLSSDEPGFQPYPIIDDNGCSLEESLFKNVQYPNHFEAGIFNPFPIRFRASSAAVVLFCVTTVVPIEHGKCTRRQCQ